jgi:uncharacterized phage-like protein YoqJ
MSSQNEIGKLEKKYRDMHESVSSSFARNTSSWNMSFLYKNLLKNAEKVKDMGAGGYPVLDHNYDGELHHFSHSPEFSRHFNKSLPELVNLVSHQQIDRQGQVLSPPDCFSLRYDPTKETDTQFLQRKQPRQGYEAMRIPRINEDSLQHCANDECFSCDPCKKHQELALESLRGILSPDKMIGNGMRNLHVKNLITTLNSWACHLDSRGNDRVSAGDVNYKNDRGEHAQLATSLRSIANKFTGSLQADYDNSNRQGGSIHRDYMGDDHGKDTSVA